MGLPTSETIQLGQLTMRFVVDGRHTDGHVAVAEMTVPAGARVPPPHFHNDLDETVTGLAGCLTYIVDGVAHKVTLGTSIFSPRGKPHSFENRGEASARASHVLAGDDFGPQYFRDIAEAMAGGPPDPKKLVSVMNRYGLEVVAHRDGSPAPTPG